MSRPLGDGTRTCLTAQEMGMDGEACALSLSVGYFTQPNTTSGYQCPKPNWSTGGSCSPLTSIVLPLIFRALAYS